MKHTKAEPDVLKQLADFDPSKVDDESPECARCGETMEIRHGACPSMLCDPCAQEALLELAAQWKAGGRRAEPPGDAATKVLAKINDDARTCPICHGRRISVEDDMWPGAWMDGPLQHTKGCALRACLPEDKHE